MSSSDCLPENFDFDLLEEELRKCGYSSTDVAELMESSEAMGISDVLDLLSCDSIEHLLY